MYRALALRAIEWDASFDDEAALLKLAEDSSITLDRTIGGNRVLVNKKDVSARIRERDVSERRRACRCIRRCASGWWRGSAKWASVAGGDGRARYWDEGFSRRDLKIFLDADPVIREQRRLDQQRVKGAPAEAMAAELRERDHRDRTRAASPLVAAEDAVVLDSTHLSEDEVLERIEKLVEQRLAARR